MGKCIFYVYFFNFSRCIKERNICIVFKSVIFIKLLMKSDRIYIIFVLKLELFIFNKVSKLIYYGNLFLIFLEEEV